MEHWQILGISLAVVILLLTQALFKSQRFRNGYSTLSLKVLMRISLWDSSLHFLQLLTEKITLARNEMDTGPKTLTLFIGICDETGRYRPLYFKDGVSEGIIFQLAYQVLDPVRTTHRTEKADLFQEVRLRKDRLVPHLIARGHEREIASRVEKALRKLSISSHRNEVGALAPEVIREVKGTLLNHFGIQVTDPHIVDFMAPLHTKPFTPLNVVIAY